MKEKKENTTICLCHYLKRAKKFDFEREFSEKFRKFLKHFLLNEIVKRENSLMKIKKSFDQNFLLRENLHKIFF